VNNQIEEIEDDEYESIVKQRRHEELVSSLKAIKVTLEKDINTEVFNAINTNNIAILNAINKLVEEETKPEIEKEEIDLTPILKEIRFGQEKILDLLSRKPIQLKIERGINNLITNINIKYGSV
jgi:hypothetical protein